MQEFLIQSKIYLIFSPTLKQCVEHIQRLFTHGRCLNLLPNAMSIFSSIQTFLSIHLQVVLRLKSLWVPFSRFIHICIYFSVRRSRATSYTRRNATIAPSVVDLFALQIQERKKDMQTSSRPQLWLSAPVIRAMAHWSMVCY